MRGVAIMLILYSVPMVFYGSLEIAHDLLHHLAAHHYSAVHNHAHDNHHTIHDHEHFSSVDAHSHVSHEDGLQESLPSLINFFLYVQRKQDFNFNTNFLQVVHNGDFLKLPIIGFPPTVPPPQRHLTT